MTDDAVRRSIIVQAPLDQAFRRFTDGMLAWWPREFTFGEDGVEAVIFEPRPDGRWYERTATGEETDWGTVLEWKAPHRIVLAWQISPERTPEPDAAHGSRVAISFTAESDASTRIELEHSEFARHGDGGEIMRAGMDSPEGWTKILERFTSTFT